MTKDEQETIDKLRKVANQSLVGDHNDHCWEYHYKCAINKLIVMYEEKDDLLDIEMHANGGG